jgi:hypothetical protein
MKKALLFAVIVLLYACKTKEEVTPKVEEIVSIPDANFEKYLVDNNIDKDGFVNRRMDVDDEKGEPK